MKLTSAVCAAILCASLGAGLAASAETALLKANPKRVNFGTKTVGTFTVKGATITNTGSSDVLVQTFAVRMPDQFSWGLLDGQTCPIFEPALLSAGESCGVVAGFRPEEFFAGREDIAVLEVVASDPATHAQLGAVAVEFRGTGKS